MEAVHNGQFQEKFSELIEKLENTQCYGGRCPTSGELDAMEEIINLFLDCSIPESFDRKAALERLRPFVSAVGFTRLKNNLTNFINHIDNASR